MNAQSSPERPHLRPRGSNHSGMRQYNERVVLQAIRLHGDLPKADLARLTHLSTQTVSLIVNRLLDDALLIKREPLRGRIGQPSIPIALNPEGAFSIGVKIGRRSMDMLLIDFTGHVRERHSVAYEFPEPEAVFEELRLGIQRMQALLGSLRTRLAGVGVAAPLALGGWQALLGMPPAHAQRWHVLDLPERLRALTDLPVHFIKDTSAACVAELVAGRGRNVKSFLYLFIDTFIGGGLVMDSQLVAGVRGNAGAVGSMPLHAASQGSEVPQVLSAGSLFRLQALYKEAGLSTEAALDARALEAPWRPLTLRWLEEASQAMALTIVSSVCLLDIDDVIVDGVFSRELLAAVLQQAQVALSHHSWEGIHRPTLHIGTIGSDARAIGGALLPLYADFAPDPEVFLKTA
jgi:predicted NBD/HSP70 family sugar kinase